MCNSLYLSPLDNALPGVETGDLVMALREIGFLGEPLADRPGGRAFGAGPGFAGHVAFAGCSPYLKLAPADASDQCYSHVALHGPWREPRLVTGPHTTPPRCPACGNRVTGWRELAPQPPETRWTCGSCGKTLPVVDLNWRHYAASGRFLLEIVNVFPGEALPGDRLMRTLEDVSGRPWTHAWSTARTAWYGGE